MQYTYDACNSDYLAHHGIKGQKWGIRRFQNLDGSLTPAGREHYNVGSSRIGSKKETMPSKSSPDAPKDLVDTAKKVNGGRDIFNYGYNRYNNCAFCSVSYEARRRGMNVQAQESLNGVIIGNKLGYFKELYSNYKTDMTKQVIKRSIGEMSTGMKDDEYDSMVNDILKDGENSRGQLTCYWKARHPNGLPQGGHAFNYEVKDGKFYIVDPQVGEVYSDKDARQYLSMVCDLRRTRTDNLKMNTDLAMRKYSEESTRKIDIDKALKAAYKWYNVNKVSRVASAIGTPGGIIAAMVTTNPGFLAIPAATIATSAITKAGLNASLAISNKNQRIRYADLEAKWKKEGRDEWYTTETESTRRRRTYRDSFGNERRQP